MKDEDFFSSNYVSIKEKLYKYCRKVSTHETTALDVASFFDDLKAYGKAEYERGLTHHADILKDFKIFLEDNRSLIQEIEILRAILAELENESIELQEQNKKLMRENINLIELRHE